MKKKLRIVSRKSPLALWQANYVKTQLMTKFPGCQVEIIGMTTEGDRFLETSLVKKGGKGLFVKELEQALLDGRADMAVHSMKDMTLELPQGLGLVAVLARDNPRDALVSATDFSLHTLPLNAKVGTSSLRRQAQLRFLRPDLQVDILRGNVGTRLDKLDQGNFDAIVLASAGLQRLGLFSRIGYEFTLDECLPAVGQGILGIECATHDRDLWDMLHTLDDLMTHQCLVAERAMNFQLNGGCQVPIGGFAQIEQGILSLRGLVGSPDGKHVLRASYSGSPIEAHAIGFAVAKDLIAKGAADILDAIRN